jgi:quercetin dioxygenase-like cupin family protein
VQTLAPDPLVHDPIVITHVPADPEVVQVEAGAELRWADCDTDHHIVVMSGCCQVLDRHLHAGGSAFVPAGLDHSIRAGAWGCTFASVRSTHWSIEVGMS